MSRMDVDKEIPLQAPHTPSKPNAETEPHEFILSDYKAIREELKALRDHANSLYRHFHEDIGPRMTGGESRFHLYEDDEEARQRTEKIREQVDDAYKVALKSTQAARGAVERLEWELGELPLRLDLLLELDVYEKLKKTEVLAIDAIEQYSTMMATVGGTVNQGGENFRKMQLAMENLRTWVDS